VSKQIFLDILESKPVNDYPKFMEYIGKRKPLHGLKLKITDKQNELLKGLIVSTLSLPIVSRSVSSDSVQCRSFSSSASSSVSEFSPTRYDHNTSQISVHPLPRYSLEMNCAHEYSEHLKAKYKILPVTSMQGWYDEHNNSFINVTIEKNFFEQKGKQVDSYSTSPEAIMKHRIQYSSKTCNCIEEIFLPDNVDRKQLILIEGDAGTGKTTLSHKVCKDWASGAMLKNKFTHVILIHLREQKPDYVVSPIDLFADMGIDAYAKLAMDQKNTVLFWLDGWDEIHDSYKKHSVFTKLLAGDAFPCATVVVTTRPSATTSLKNYRFSQKFKLKGFSESQIKDFVKDYFSKHLCDEILSELFMQQLRCVRSLTQLAEVPLHLSILLKVFFDKFNLPNTLTEIYHNVLLVVLQYHKEKTYGDERPIKDLDDLPNEMLEMLHGLEKYAYDCYLMKNPISQEQVLCDIFGSKDKQLQDFDGMGLLQVKIVSGIIGNSKYYQFRYRIIQEFLAAVYLTRLHTPKEMIPNETKELIRIFGDMNYEMVWVFYAGISELGRVPLKEVLPKLNNPAQPTVSLPLKTHEELVDRWQQCHAHFKFITQSESFSVDFLLTLMLCCYEAGNSKACEVIADHFYPSNICRIEIPPNRATSYLLSAVSYFITHSKKKWSLRCDAIIPSGIERLLSITTATLQSETSSGIWILCFVVTSSEVEKYIDLIKMQPSLQWIHLLNGSCLGDEGTSKLCDFLATFKCSIVKVELENCNIGGIGLKSIATMLKANEKIVYINLRRNCFDLKDIEALLQDIKHSTSLQYLVLDEKYSKDVKISSFLNKINSIRSTKKVNSLSLNHDFLVKYNKYYKQLQFN